MIRRAAVVVCATVGAVIAAVGAVIVLAGGLVTLGARELERRQP